MENKILESSSRNLLDIIDELKTSYDIRKVLQMEPEYLEKKYKVNIIKDNKTIRNNRYLEIGNVEELLNLVFDSWDIPEMEILTMANGVVVNLKLVVKLDNGWQRTFWGVGGAPFQLNQGAAKNDATAIKTTALLTAPASAKSEALKNAAKNLGRLFGSHLNREQVFDFTEIVSTHNKIKDYNINDYLDQINNVETLEALSDLTMTLPDKAIKDIKIINEISKCKKQLLTKCKKQLTLTL